MQESPIAYRRFRGRRSVVRCMLVYDVGVSMQGSSFILDVLTAWQCRPPGIVVALLKGVR